MTDSSTEPVREGSKEFLLAELRYFADSFWRNEESGEKRVTFFLTLVTAVTAAVVALATSQRDLSRSKIGVGAAVAFLALFVVGWFVFRRLIRRNAVADEHKTRMDEIRKIFRDWDPAGLAAYVPFPVSARRDRTFGGGGLTDLVAVINGTLFAAAMAALAALSRSLAVTVAVLLVAFVLAVVLQLWALIRIRAFGRVLPAKWSRQPPASAESASQFFRANVGIAVLDDVGQVLALERYEFRGTWQLAQGGLDEHEEPADAARRELHEETGLSWDQVEVVGEYPCWLAYELEPGQRKADTGRGQVQKWFVVRLTDRDAKIDLKRVDERKGHPEFADYAWMSLAELIAKAAAFRRPVYDALATYIRSTDSSAGR